jgi:methyl-accepting chemotaxis protein
MSAIMSGTRGLAGVALTFVIAWALIAVLLLTGTLVTTHQIDRDVHAFINPRLEHIGQHTANIPLAATTQRITGEIRRAAVPLTGELAGTLTAAKQIEASAKTILARAQTINGTVVSIHGRVLTIGSTVTSIASNVSAIGADVASIHASADGIYASVSSVGTDVTSILASARGIGASVQQVHTNAEAILSTGRQIVPRVNGINARAVAVAGVVRTIDSGLASVLGLVGSIDGHANGINCSKLLNTTLLGGPTTDCGT